MGAVALGEYERALDAGHLDFIVHVAVRDMNQMRDLVWGLIERREVGRVQSSLVFERVEGGALEPLDG